MLMHRSGKVLDKKVEDRSRSVWAEAFSTIVSSLGVPVSTIASLTATVWLGIEGHTVPSIVTAVPFVALSVTQVTIVFRGKPKPDNDD